MTYWEVVSVICAIVGFLAAGSIFVGPFRVAPKPLEPVPELVPAALWRANLDAALEEMTLQNPTINYNRVNSWTPYAESAPGYARDVARNYQRELIQKSFSAGGFVQQVPPERTVREVSAGIRADVITAEVIYAGGGVSIDNQPVFIQGVQAGSALEDEEILWDYDNPESFGYDPNTLEDRVVIFGLAPDGTEVRKMVRVTAETSSIMQWGKATPLRVNTHLLY